MCQKVTKRSQKKGKKLETFNPQAAAGRAGCGSQDRQTFGFIISSVMY